MEEKYWVGWFRRGFLALFLVAFMGVLMRYKIAFSFPLLDQKHMQEAHSHFAFYGWITQLLYVLFYRYLTKVKPQEWQSRIYPIILKVNFSLAILMLLGFLWRGYFWFTITISTLSLLLSFIIFFSLYKDLRTVKNKANVWILGGLFFAMLSSLGVASLSYMMASGHIYQNIYLASTYYYLHFQYNGFFLFACIGLFIFQIENLGAKISDKDNRLIFKLLFFSCIFGYGLSILWVDLPLWVFILILLASILQTLGAVKLFFLVKKNWAIIRGKMPLYYQWIIIYVAIAFFVKILLQLGSNIPSVNQFAFGFRNVVIAYLHLVLLMCISTFLVGQIFTAINIKPIKKIQHYGILLFLIFVFLNELLLGIIGIYSITYRGVPYASYGLLVISIGILVSVLIMWLSTNVDSR